MARATASVTRGGALAAFLLPACTLPFNPALLPSAGSDAGPGTRDGAVDASVAPAPCDYYASPSGGGDGLSEGSPFTVQEFWPLAQPGRTLCLLDGIYTGDESVIDPGTDIAGVAGVPGRPITVRALDDGGALIDGEHERRPVYLRANDWWVIEGLDAKSGLWGVVVVSDSSYTVVRRLVAWDASMVVNNGVVDAGGRGNLFEDVAAFGVGRRVFGGGSYTCRRCWARWEGSTNQNWKGAYRIGFAAGPAARCENCLATWTAESMPDEYDVTDNDGPIGPHHVDGTIADALAVFEVESNTSSPCVSFDVLGSLSYALPGHATLPGNRPPRMIRVKDASCVAVRHTVSFVPPSHPLFDDIPSFELGNHGGDQTDVYASNITSVRASSDHFDPDWTVTGLSQGTSLDMVADPWTATDVGANLCYRWTDGEPTTEPLWPWPMNDRIRAATASAGAYDGPCPGCVGGRNVRTETDVTADVESLLGAIPAACRR